MASFSFEEEALSKKVNLGIWGKIFPYALRKWYLLAVLLVLMTLTSFHDASLIPMLNRAAIDSLRDVSNTSLDTIELNVRLIFGIQFTLDFWGYAGVLLGAMILRSIFIYFTFFATNYLEMSIYIAIRQDAFRRVQTLSFSYFDKTSSGWLIARLQSDTSKISDIISWGIIRLLWITFDLTFTLITMFAISWQMSLLLLATTPLMIVIAPYFQIKILQLSRISRNAFSGYVAWLAEVIAGAKTVKTLAIEENVQQEASEIVSDIQVKAFRTAKMQALFYPTVAVISAFSTAVMIYFGYLLLQGNVNTVIIEVSTFVLFIGFVRAVYQPIQEYTELFTDLMATQSSVEKILSLIETQPAIIDRSDVIEKYGTLFNLKQENFEPIQGEVSFDHVSFSYNPGVEIIHDMNLTIKQGTSVAIVGETGSGKSTTVNLLCRFYEPSQGSLKIDGVDYRDRSVAWLRSNIGYVQQTPFVFSGSIKKNIAYGKLKATDDEVIEAAKAVGVHAFIMSLPKGYETILKDGGSELSVGQKQLLSFARAIIRNPRIMILDEATSSIDTETEASIQQAIRKILKGRTSIIIAHRLSTIVDSDRILVMKEGVIIEDGNHASLIHKKGHYHRLYMNQFAELKVEEQITTYESQMEKLTAKKV
jgi:ATP-binding cassette subfamily B protein